MTKELTIWDRELSRRICWSIQWSFMLFVAAMAAFSASMAEAGNALRRWAETWEKARKVEK